MGRTRRIEIASYGVDETRQLSGTSPFGGSAWVGLRVPTLATAALTPAGQPRRSFRYLFNGASFSIGAGVKAKVVGYRQYHEIGFLVTDGSGVRAITLPVTTPGWAFPDATVSWHFRLLGPPNAQGLPSFTPAPQNGQNLIKGWATGPALLYQTITLPAADPYYVDLTAYVPPNGGRPFGRPLTDHPQASNLLGLATDWRTPDAWGSLDVDVSGPDTVAALISVAQTDPTTYPALPFTAAQAGIGVSPEDAFLANAILGSAHAIQWRVGVSLIVETDLDGFVGVAGRARVVG